MPPWVAFVQRSTCLLSRRGISRSTSFISYRNTPIRAPPPCSNLRIRFASTQVSPTAINAGPSIPPRKKELYNALSELSDAAETYVNISRLQLALRGLSVEDPVVRVAVLSLSDQRCAQKLVRLLLADPLSAEGLWEKLLEASEDEVGRAVLLRYGDETDAHPPNPLFKILSIPSRTLQAYNLEVLVSTLNADLSGSGTPCASEEPGDAIIVPKLQASLVRSSPSPYPVHKTLVLGEGIDSAVAYGRYANDSLCDMKGIVKLAIDAPASLDETSLNEENTCSLVNLTTGTKALASFRESIANSRIYEKGWHSSGMPNLSHWLIQGLHPSGSQLKPAIKQFIESVTDDIEANIMREAAHHREKAAIATTPRQEAASILKHLDSWAETAHTELRDQLDEAFEARNWHKISWWKLLWRVDDVGMITSEILERRWLVDAEKNCIYLAGRINQAGFPENIQSLQPTSPLPQAGANEQFLQNNPSSSTPIPLDQETPLTKISTERRSSQPWRSQISVSRTSLLQETVPHLQALAQRLVLTTLSTTSLSTALSALFYVSIPSFSVFEASAIAALGFVYSLRRMQKLWERARGLWQAEVREEGRKTLKVVEEGVRVIVEGYERPIVEDVGVERRRRAREVVGKVREALGKV
ncbi:uncharacterized protein BDR25DRAFT_308152, partial [Lindgomyces ingoldianus]